MFFHNLQCRCILIELLEMVIKITQVEQSKVLKTTCKQLFLISFFFFYLFLFFLPLTFLSVWSMPLRGHCSKHELHWFSKKAADFSVDSVGSSGHESLLYPACIESRRWSSLLWEPVVISILQWAREAWEGQTPEGPLPQPGPHSLPEDLLL